jgi:hypothetical protein
MNSVLRIQSAQRESNPHFRHGKATGCRYIMGAIWCAELSKILPQRAISRTLHAVSTSETSEHREGLEPSSPHYGCGILAAE